MLDTSNLWIPVTLTGTSLDMILYLTMSISFLACISFIRGHRYEMPISIGYVPVVIARHGCPYLTLLTSLAG
jgi:hypothetical protein